MRAFGSGTGRRGGHSCFDIGQAARLAHAAELVYADVRQVQHTVHGWGMHDFEFFDVQDTQAFVAADDASLIVVFRGTEPDSLQDWITDASTDLVKGPLDGEVHAGFYDALANIWHSLDQFVEQLQKDRRRRLLVTGHSLGASLATLAVARWLEAGRPVESLYTFGQPRTGDNTFARSFNFAFKPSTFRFVNNNDLVTRIPPRSFGYSHLGSIKYFTEDGELGEDIGWWQQFLQRWSGRIVDVFSSIQDGIDDHSMSAYRSRVEAISAAGICDQRRAEVAIDRFLRPFSPRLAATSRRAA